MSEHPVQPRFFAILPLAALTAINLAATDLYLPAVPRLPAALGGRAAGLFTFATLAVPAFGTQITGYFLDSGLWPVSIALLGFTIASILVFLWGRRPAAALSLSS